MQQRARKEERKAAHKKYVARVMAKKHMNGLKISALKGLKDQGMLVQPIDQVMHEQVLPWMIEKMQEFLK